jgi:hypothetical protein
METLNDKDLKQLLEVSGEWLVSIYMPTHRKGREQQQDPIRFTNMTVRAREKLLASGLRPPDVDRIMQPADELQIKGDFWRHQGDGLAVFLAPGFSAAYRLPRTFKEMLVVSRKFHLKPLFPLLTNDEQFYILAISLKDLRLFLASPHSVSQVEIPEGTPTSMPAALRMDDPERQLGFHTGTSASGLPGKRPAVFHGQGLPTREEHKNIRRYFQQVDDGLAPIFKQVRIPLVLAGVSYLFPIYRDVNSYPGLLENGLEGNPDELNANELQERAFDLVRPLFDRDRRRALQQFEQLHGKQNDLATSDLETAVKAAHFGNVDTLFVPLGVQRWGRFDPEKSRLTLVEDPGPENEDLLDLAAIQTILNSGKVYALPPDLVPGGGDLAAILRYPA